MQLCGSSLTLSPNLTLHMLSMGILSADGSSWSFDTKGNGYTREIVHALSNNDGYKTAGINSPSGIVQSKLFAKLYDDANVDPLNVKYVEAHVTGTIVGDFEECSAIDSTFNKNRVEPLLVGRIKSSMGHSEGASGTCAIAKIVHSFQTDVIPATIHVKNLRRDIPGLVEGRLKVCTENTPLPGPLVAVNSFGYGGSNAHVLLRQFDKAKDLKQTDRHPRLVIWSGRTEEAVSTVIERIKSTPYDVEFIGLLHQIQRVQIPENTHRGFGVFENNGNDQTSVCLSEKIAQMEDDKRPVVWLFTEMGCQWEWNWNGKIAITHSTILQFNLDVSQHLEEI